MPCGLTGAAEYGGGVACEIPFAESLQNPINLLSFSFEVKLAA